MSIDPKSPAPSPSPAAPPRHKGMKIFTYPKIIFIWPTFVTAIICSVGMMANRDETHDPSKYTVTRSVNGKEIRSEPNKPAERTDATTPAAPSPKKRFTSPQNVMAMFFITVFFFNLLIMSIDFPRFTIIAIVLLAAALTFFLLWLNVSYDLLPPLVALLEKIFASANSAFYALVAVVIGINFGIIWVSRYLDYWEILPNEILHNHGPFSDLERFPTTNLKFDKEIPDILEYALLRSGRLVLHVQNERKAIVLDNVLWIDAKENELKKMMSRMEVRITSDQEAAGESV